MVRRYVAIVVLTVLPVLGFAQGLSSALPSYDQAAHHVEWGRYEEAFAILDALVGQPDGGSGKVYLMLGTCLTMLDRPDEAHLALYTAAYKYPDDDQADDALLALLGALKRTGRAAGLVEVCERLADRYPDSPHAAYARTSAGWLYGSRGEKEKAAAALAQVARDYPTSSYAQTARQSMNLMGVSVPASAPKAPPVAPPSTPSAVSDGILRVRAYDPFVVRTAATGVVEIFVGDTLNPRQARLHLRRAPSGMLAMRFEGQWVQVGAQGAYGHDIVLLNARRDGDEIVWTLRHDLAVGMMTSVYVRDAQGWTQVAEVHSARAARNMKRDKR